uniref:C-type lectin domain-containing protein n=1 Tax=Chinchilla lanigera TaxID=34839 RepID=A0A8C2W3P4_CHILA
MVLRGPQLLLCVLLLTQVAAEAPTSKPKKAANVRKWLGLHDLGSEGSWVDASGAPAAFARWETEITAQPDGGTAENCVAMAGEAHGRWFDERCRDELPYVCQFAIV